MGRLVYNFTATIATAALVASVFFGCSQTVVPSEEDIQLAEEQQRILEHSSSSKKKSSAQSSSSEKNMNILDAIEKAGEYTTRDSVAAYLCKFGNLPHNYVGKNEGKKLYEAKGYTFSKWNFNPWTTLGVMIGGDNFDNFASDPEYYHKNLPEGKYHEADVDYSGKNRGTKRLVYQADCVIYYTADHYETYTLLNF